MKTKLAGAAIAPLLLIAACAETETEEAAPAMPDSETTATQPAETGPAETAGAGMTVGAVDYYDERGRGILPEGTVIEKLTEDTFSWSEGPVWIADDSEAGGYVLFSDVPENVIYKWSAEQGLETWLQPSGYDGEPTDGFREPGTNGLIPASDGDAILAGSHGDRAIVRIDLATKEKTLIVGQHDGQKFSSPNDLVMAGDGSVYFTDPPYGLAGIDDSPLKEIAFNGVYRLGAGALDGGVNGEAGAVSVVDDSLSKPNGVILSPDGTTLYVAQSDPAAAIIYAYDLAEDGLPAGDGARRVFADLTGEVGQAMPGLPDGMAMDTAGNLYATGPGGIRIFAPDGMALARIDTGTAAANVTFGGPDGGDLYITSGPFLARVETTATGLGF